jgi:hypothetical protein
MAGVPWDFALDEACSTLSHRLRGPLWPAHEQAVAACHQPQPSRAHSRLKDGSAAVLRPFASPGALRTRLFSTPQPHIRPIENPKSLTPPTGLFNPGLCGGGAPHESLIRSARLWSVRPEMPMDLSLPTSLGYEATAV